MGENALWGIFWRESDYVAEDASESKIESTIKSRFGNFFNSFGTGAGWPQRVQVHTLLKHKVCWPFAHAAETLGVIPARPPGERFQLATRHNLRQYQSFSSQRVRAISLKFDVAIRNEEVADVLGAATVD